MNHWRKTLPEKYKYLDSIIAWRVFLNSIYFASTPALNIDVEIDNRFRKVITYSPKENVIKDVVFFIGKAVTDNLVIDQNELLEAKWVNANDAKNYFNYQDNIDVFEEALEYLSN